MALSVLRNPSYKILFNPRLILATNRTPCLSAVCSTSAAAPPTPAEAQTAFWKKNSSLKRPLSPWIIYKFQLTMMLSISHRITGTGLGMLLYGWGISNCFAGNTNWAQQLAWIHNTFPQWSLYSLKVLVAASLGYHFFNGIRHLVWDLGYGFSIKQLYTSGYFVVGITILTAILAALNA